MVDVSVPVQLACWSALHANWHLDCFVEMQFLRCIFCSIGLCACPDDWDFFYLVKRVQI